MLKGMCRNISKGYPKKGFQKLTLKNRTKLLIQKSSKANLKKKN